MIDRLQPAMMEGRSDARLDVDVASRLMEQYRKRIEAAPLRSSEAETVRRLEAADRRFRLAAPSRAG